MSKRPQGKSSKKKQSARSGSKGAAEATGTPTVTGTGRIVIIAFAVIMALSMMLPSLSAIFSSGSSASEQESQPASTSDTGDSSSSASDSSASDAATTGVAAIDASYQARVDPLTEKYDEDPKNLATLLNLGNAYMSWGVNVSYAATDDEASAHAQDLFDQALDYYDQYLALNDTEAVRVNVALCKLYGGDSDAALSDLKALTKASPDYGPAWANLGMVYEATGDTDSALEAYAKAVETDPDDEYGAKTYAETRTTSINSANSSASTTTSTVGQGLSDTLKNHDGTNL